MQPVSSTRDILIQTQRSNEARAFYEGVLGFTVVHDDPAMCGLDTGSFRLFIDPAPPLGPVLEFEVDDVSATKAHLLASGCSVIEESATIPRCYIGDPFGLIFNLRQRAPSDLHSSGTTAPASDDQHFGDQNLAGAVFQDCSLSRSRFEDDDLSESSFSNVNFAHARFTNVSLAGVIVEDADIAGLTILGHDIQELIRAELVRRREV